MSQPNEVETVEAETRKARDVLGRAVVALRSRSGGPRWLITEQFPGEQGRQIHCEGSSFEEALTKAQGLLLDCLQPGDQRSCGAALLPAHQLRS